MCEGCEGDRQGAPEHADRKETRLLKSVLDLEDGTCHKVKTREGKGGEEEREEREKGKEGGRKRGTEGEREGGEGEGRRE